MTGLLLRLGWGIGSAAGGALAVWLALRYLTGGPGGDSPRDRVAIERSRELTVFVVTAVASAALGYTRAGSAGTGSMLVVLWLGIVVTTLDVSARVIPNRLLLAGALVGLVTLPGLAGVEAGIEGAVGLFVLNALVALVSRSSLGFGDVKYMAVVGLLLGLFGGLGAMVLAYLAGGLYAGALLLMGRADRHSALAFGPFIAAASLMMAVLLHGPLVPIL